MALFDGPEGSTIITERNKKALEVLTSQIQLGRNRIGIFYGAGHLPDMHDRLVNEFGLETTGHQWLTAWRLVPRLPRKAAQPADSGPTSEPDAAGQAKRTSAETRP